MSGTCTTNTAVARPAISGRPRTKTATSGCPTLASDGYVTPMPGEHREDSLEAPFAEPVPVSVWTTGYNVERSRIGD
jgi:hypothetical protein